MNKPSSLKVETPSDREVRVTRKFKAPAQLVWDAHTRPELVRKWQYGFEGWSLPICEMDVRVGGAYRWRWRSDQDGTDMGFFGKYIEVTMRDGESRAEVATRLDEMCRKLLANTVIEDYRFEQDEPAT